MVSVLATDETATVSFFGGEFEVVNQELNGHHDDLEFPLFSGFLLGALNVAFLAAHGVVDQDTKGHQELDSDSRQSGCGGPGDGVVDEALDGDDDVLFGFEVVMELAVVLNGVFEAPVVVVFEVAVEVLEAFAVAFARLLDIDIASFSQSTKLHRSLQSRKHISVQLEVPLGQPQVQRSVFEL